MNSQHKSLLLPQITILRRSSKPVSGGVEYPETFLPNDLIIEIFSRLPAKSIARFRCVSKLWASIFRRPDFTELFFTRSLSRPQVFFLVPKDDETFFFTIPQPRNHDEILSPVVATYVMKIPFRAEYGRFSNSNGLFFLRQKCISDTASPNKELSTMVIFNPSTRQSLSIPNLNLKWWSSSKCFMGYDPIEKQYKLLSFAKPSYQVLTLGSGNLLWRDILCSREHYHLWEEICIDGVLYYLAGMHTATNVGYIMIVSFDFKSEKFNFIKTMENYIEERCIATLINYNGKLASIKADDTFFVNGSSEILKIWVLEDPKKQEWSQHIHVLPPLWKDVVGEPKLFIVGVIGTDEIVFSSIIINNSSFYVVYYNTKRKSVVKVEIQGMEMCKDIGFNTFLNHVENLKLLS